MVHDAKKQQMERCGNIYGMKTISLIALNLHASVKVAEKKHTQTHRARLAYTHISNVHADANSHQTYKRT